MITANEIIDDLKNVMSKVEYMAITYKNNTIWKETDSILDSTIAKIQKDRRIYGY